MKWNPTALRWEGNEHILRDFDVTIASTMRPALITHLSVSSASHPAGSFGSADRIVGNMIFDPAQMCWMSISSSEKEVDVFADLDDDENMSVDEEKGDTIREQRDKFYVKYNIKPKAQQCDISARYVPYNIKHTLTQNYVSSESESDRGSRALLVYHIDNRFLDICRLVENRHQADMKGWMYEANLLNHEMKCLALYEIRALATRQY